LFTGTTIYRADSRTWEIRHFEPLLAKFADDELGLFLELDRLRSDFIEKYFIEGIYYNSPVFELELGGYDAEMEMRRFKVTGRIVSHSGAVLENRTWESIMGFDPAVLMYKNYKGPLESRPTHEAIAHGHWLARCGLSREEAFIKHDKNDDNKDLPHGWNPNFNLCPAC